MIPRIDFVSAEPLDFAAVLHGAREREAAPLDTRVLSATLAFDRAEEGQRRLAEGALVVTTGQQPGLLGGPLYTMYKALAAVALAARLERELDRPVVPVFWVGGDDHDFEEANHVALINVANELLELTLRLRSPAAAQLPLYREPVGPGIEALLAQVDAATPDTEFKPELLAQLARCYAPEASLADACARLLAEWFGPLGLVVLRPYAASAKQAAAALVVEALALRSETLVLSGPVDTPADTTLVMIEGELGRDRLVRADGGYRARRSGETWSTEDLERVAQEEPERLSPNVLLRPVVEACLLDTVAYIAGPSEFEYLAQARPLYAPLGVRRQIPVPRFGLRIIESRIAKVLEKFQLAPSDLAGPAGQLESRLVREQLPEDVHQAFDELRQSLRLGYARLETGIGDLAPTLRKPVKSAYGTAQASLKGLEKRLVAHLKRENDILVQQLDKARVHLYPRGTPQERHFPWPMYAVRYGPPLLAGLAAEASEWAAQLPLEAGAS